MAGSSFRRVVTGVIAASALLVGACSGNDDDGPSVITEPSTSSSSSESATTESTTTTDPEAELKAEVGTAYRDQWDAQLKIFRDPDPANPLIDQYYIGQSKEAVLDSVSQALTDGWVMRAPSDPANFEVVVESVTITGDKSAELVACLVDGIVQIDRASGDVLNDDVVTKINTAEMALDEGSWKISDSSVERLEGNPRCDDR